MTITEPNKKIRIPHNREPYKKLEKLTEKEHINQEFMQSLDRIVTKNMTVHELIKEILKVDSAEFYVHKTWDCLDSRVEGATVVIKK
jgi:hypothetical protein